MKRIYQVHFILVLLPANRSNRCTEETISMNAVLRMPDETAMDNIAGALRNNYID